MTLRTRLVLTSLGIAVPVAGALYVTAISLRTRDMAATIERYVRMQLTDAGRYRCETDPLSFPAGPGRPAETPPVDPNDPNSDVPPPRRGLLEPHPLEVFAYTDEFIGEHPAAPRFPQDLKRALDKASTVTAPWVTKDGTGVQFAIVTNWKNPCAILLGEIRPPANQASDEWLLLGTLLITVFIVGLAAGAPTVWRVHRLAGTVREAARKEYAEIVPVRGRDEVGSLAFAFNEAGGVIRRKMVDVREREDALRRFVTNTTEDLEPPLVALQGHLSNLERDQAIAPAAKAHVRAALGESHDMASRLGNIAAMARLRDVNALVAHTAVDLNALVERVSARHRPAARAAEVELTVALPAKAVSIQGDATFLEQAVSNLVDNAIQYNAPGGHIAIVLDRDDRDRRFSLHVTDDGVGVMEEDLKRLAIRRFRTGEARARRPDALGLGLEIVREVAAKFNLHLAFRRPSGGGFEAELSGTY